MQKLYNYIKLCQLSSKYLVIYFKANNILQLNLKHYASENP